MTDLPERLTAAISNKALSIGEAWNLLQDAADEIELLTKERDGAVNNLCRWRSAFQECTPGGSEFMDPESVREYMQRNKSDMIQAKMDRTRAEKASRLADRRGFERAREAMLCRLDQLVVILPDVKDESVLAYLARIMELLRTGYKKEVRAIPYTTDEGENK